MRPSWIPDWFGRLTAGDDRHTDLVLDFAFVEATDARLRPPDGARFSIRPINERVECPWARADIQVAMEGDEVLHRTSLSLEQTRIPAAEYGEWLKFLRRVRDLANSPIEVVREEGRGRRHPDSWADAARPGGQPEEPYGDRGPR